MATTSRLCIGLMSGTSMDAVDAVLARFPAPGDRGGQARHTAPFQTLGFASAPLPQDLRCELAALQAPGPNELHRAALAANALAELYAQAVQELLAATGTPAASVAAIGAHGQTVRHRPEAGYTLQLNNPALLAERTGIDVVADLRSRDVAAGGQGAPLVPAFHAIAFGHATERRAIVNIGGIANLSVLEPGGLAPGDRGIEPGGPAPEDREIEPRRSAPKGWDCGPGNVLMDAWCERHLGLPYDADGRWAAGGRVLPALLAAMRAEPYFARPAPKSTGRDLFHSAWLDARLHEAGLDSAAPPRAASPADVQATLLELTASTIADACRSARPDRVLLCGGGAANGALRARIAALLAPTPVGTTDDAGVPPQAVEALAFAWLASEFLAGRPASVPEVTGAAGPRRLGALWPGR